MKQQKPEIIRDKKTPGEWAEAVFAARAAEKGLAVSKPSGDSESFDYVIGHPGKFVAVQVKCTIARQHNAKGYICNLKCNNKKYREGSCDFVAAYAILEDTWYIVPETAIRGLGAITLCSTMPKYERYREAWELLREASGGDDAPLSEQRGEVGLAQVDESGNAPRGRAFERMQTAMNSYRSYLEKGGR